MPKRLSASRHAKETQGRIEAKTTCADEVRAVLNSEPTIVLRIKLADKAPIAMTRRFVFASSQYMSKVVA